MIVLKPDSTYRTGLFTDSTANTADFTLLTCYSSFFFVRAFYYNVVCTVVDSDQVLRTDFCTFPTGNTFLFIYFCHTIFIKRNGTKLAFAYAGFTADASVLTALLT